MKDTAKLLLLLIATILGLVGCGSGGGSDDTSQAAKEIQSTASQGGATPSPDLPQPMAGAPVSNGKTGKFKLNGAGG